MREPCLDYFYGDEVRVNSFCRLPRIFVTDEFYRTIPIEIKILYSVMLDRVAMSMRNNWRENGRVFIYFTIKEAMRTLHVCKHKAVSLFARMETLGLIRRRKQERGKPDRIFVREFLEVENAEEAFPKDAADCAAMEAASVDLSPEAADIEETPVPVTEVTEELLRSGRAYFYSSSTYEVDETLPNESLLITLTDPNGNNYRYESGWIYSPEYMAEDIWYLPITDTGLTASLDANGYPKGTYQLAFFVDGALADEFSFELK